jgi:hypothetical protein
MGKVKVPSIQHAAGIWDPHPGRIAKNLLDLANNGPPFSYGNLYKLTYDLLSRTVPYEQIHRAAAAIRQTLARENYLEILPLLRDYSDGIGASAVSEIIPRNYSIGRDLRVLVNPPLAYYKEEEVYLPWFIFWKRNRFDEPRLRLFVTMMREVFGLDPDFDDASLRLVICSEKVPKGGRVLEVLDTASVAGLNKQERDNMLGVFAEGYALAVRAQIEGQRSVGDIVVERDDDSDQFDLFA